MSTDQQNNPLHGLKTETMVTELVEHYGWAILYAATRFHAFKTNPTIKGTVKFLRNTEWAREKLESFYLSRFKRMPRATEEEFGMPSRERGFPDYIVPRKPMELTIESIELSQAKSASAHEERSNEKRANNRRQHQRDSFQPNERAKDQRAAKKDKGAESVTYDPSNPWNQ